MTIARTLSLVLGVAALALPASVGKSEGSVPVSHPEPITIQILDGKGGAPLAHVHLLLVAGYDDRDLRLRLWSAEAITDARGRVGLPRALKDFSFVEVRVAKRKLCAAHGRSFGANLDRVRNEGMSTPNHCGTTVVEDTPGVLNVFARARAHDLLPPTASPAAEPPALSAAEPPALPAAISPTAPAAIPPATPAVKQPDPQPDPGDGNPPQPRVHGVQISGPGRA